MDLLVFNRPLRPVCYRLHTQEDIHVHNDKYVDTAKCALRIVIDISLLISDQEPNKLLKTSVSRHTSL